MCENGSARKFSIDDIITRINSSGRYHPEDPTTTHPAAKNSSKNLCHDDPPTTILNSRESGRFLGLRILQKFRSHEFTCPRSRSDSDLFLSSRHKIAERYKDFEGSSFPSDSDITVICVQRRSRVQRTASRVLEGVLGDGYHLAASQSMVNLATMIEARTVSPFQEEGLVPLSSWDASSEAPTNTASDTIVQRSSRISSYLEDLQSGLSHFELTSFASINDRRVSRQAATCRRLSKVVSPEYTLAFVETPAGKDFDKKLANSKMSQPADVTDDSNELVSITAGKIGDDPEIVNNGPRTESIDHSSPSRTRRDGKLFSRFSASVQRALRRTVCFSCFSVTEDKDKLNNGDQIL